MQLHLIDWVVVIAYGIVTLAVGLVFARRAGRNMEQYFLSGRKLPWWLLGTSMVATTFSTDTPNLVTDLVRTGGVSMNWLWWSFLITGMLTVFFYAKLWRRSGALTDINFYELRYSGAPAAFLRGFRAIYLGVFFNVMIMATVTLAAIKISGALLGLDPYKTVVLAALITVIYSATSGLWGVATTDLLLFVLSMIGSVAAAYYAVSQPSVGGLSGLVSNPLVSDKLSLLPDFSDPAAVLTILVIPLAVQCAGRIRKSRRGISRLVPRVDCRLRHPVWDRLPDLRKDGARARLHGGRHRLGVRSPAHNSQARILDELIPEGRGRVGG